MIELFKGKNRKETINRARLEGLQDSRVKPEYDLEGIRIVGTFNPATHFAYRFKNGKLQLRKIKKGNYIQLGTIKKLLKRKEF